METSTKLTQVLLTNSHIKTNTGVYVLYFKGCKHFYVGSSKTLTQRLYHYLNNTSIISSSVKNMIDCMTTKNLMIQLHETDEDISAIDLLKLEDVYLKQYIKMYGEEWCLNSRTNDNEWQSQDYITKNKARGKAIKCEDKFGKHIANFDSINDAVRYFKYENSGNIVACLKGRVKFSKKMKFSYL